MQRALYLFARHRRRRRTRTAPRRSSTAKSKAGGNRRLREAPPASFRRQALRRWSARLALARPARPPAGADRCVRPRRADGAFRRRGLRRGRATIRLIPPRVRLRTPNESHSEASSVSHPQPMASVRQTAVGLRGDRPQCARLPMSTSLAPVRRTASPGRATPEQPSAVQLRMTRASPRRNEEIAPLPRRHPRNHDDAPTLRPGERTAPHARRGTRRKDAL